MKPPDGGRFNFGDIEAQPDAQIGQHHEHGPGLN